MISARDISLRPQLKDHNIGITLLLSRSARTSPRMSQNQRFNVPLPGRCGKEVCDKFNPRPGRGLNQDSPGSQLEILPTALTSQTQVG